MSKHTPGPWEVRKDITKETLVCSENKTIICGIHQKNLNIISETEANANLIAAAPELLEATESIIEHFVKDEGMISHKKIVKLRDIILKAKGVDE